MISTHSFRNCKIVKPNCDDWDDYVQQHAKGSIFHTSAMIRSFAATRGLEPYAYASMDPDGRIVALLVSCHVKTLSRFSAMSSRAVQFAEPLCDPNPTGVAALSELVAMHDKHMRSRSLLCEVRSICPSTSERDALTTNGYEYLDYINYVVDTKQNKEILWSKVKKNLRQKIRSTLSKGVVLRNDNTLEGVNRLHQLLKSSYGRARVPLLGLDLFENTLANLPSQCIRVRTAFLGDVPIASIMSLVFGDRVFSWYGGTLRLNGLSPFACIVWDDIAWSSENGYAFYDFGGAGWPNENYGPRKFKADFGGIEVRYGRYMLTYSELRLRLAKLAFQLSRRMGAWSSESNGTRKHGEETHG
jgi:serine/alanine adding enzyme